MANKFHRKAKLNGDLITVYADSKTVVTRKVRDEDKESWPDLFKKKPGRPRKVDNGHQSDTESSAE